MNDGEKMLMRYATAATNLADCMRNDIHHNDGIYSEETLRAYNAFVVESNNMKNFTDGLEDEYIKYNN
jgi:hypothetical protein